MDKTYGYITKDFLVSGQYYVPIYHMDIEVLPDWWSIVFRHAGKETIFTSDDAEISEIEKITRLSIITAFNGKSYDFKILYAITKGLPPELIYEISQAIITNNAQTNNYMIKDFMRYNYWMEFNFIDLFDDITGSLKEHESNMGIAIIESNIPWDQTDLTEAQKRELLDYNVHDVVAQEELFVRRIESYYLPKIVLAEIYDLDPVQVLKDTNAKLTAKILDARKLDDAMLQDRVYTIPGHIAEYLAEYIPEEILEPFLTTGMNEINKKEMTFKDFGNKGKLGKGGIHSVKKKYLRVTNDKYHLFLIDVASYYPNLMIHFGFMSRAVRKRNKFPEIYERRKQAKRNKNKALDKALKLILNTTFGAMGQKFNPLYDPNMAWSVTITGQLLLYALAKELWMHAGCKIVQTNTDGIVVAVREKDIPRMKSFVSQWEKMTNLDMEYDPIKTLAQRDVNNYACEFTNGKTKVKGGLCMQAITPNESAFEVVTWNNHDMRITHEAVFQYLIYKKPIEQTIKECTDLRMFISTTKTGYTYQNTFHYIKDKEISVQKVNRVIAVNNKAYGTLKKFKIDKKKPRYDKVAKISDHVYIMNKDMNTYKWDTWKDRIDYDFYINVAKDKVKGWLK